MFNIFYRIIFKLIIIWLILYNNWSLRLTIGLISEIILMWMTEQIWYLIDFARKIISEKIR